MSFRLYKCTLQIFNNVNNVKLKLIKIKIHFLTI